MRSLAHAAENTETENLGKPLGAEGRLGVQEVEGVGLRLLTTTASSFIFGIRLKPRYIFLSENVSVLFTQCDEFSIASNF